MPQTRKAAVEDDEIAVGYEDPGFVFQLGVKTLANSRRTPVCPALGIIQTNPRNP